MGIHMYMDSTEENSPPRRAPPQTNTHHTPEALYPTGWKNIQKVPPHLRQEDGNSVAYDPKVVSFGPYHHGKPELKTCEEVKPFALQMFVQGSNRTEEFFYTKVLDQVIPNARNWYVNDSTMEEYTNEQLARMMLCDSCFLICYMQNQLHDLTFDRLGCLVYSLVFRDIFLIENQIPFQILMLLINLRYGNGEELVFKFLHQTIWGQYNQQHTTQVQQQNDQPLHLLDAYRRVIAWDFIPETRVRIEKDIDFKKHHKTFRSAKDLKAKGIHFKANPNKSLKAINFSSFSFYGELQLPTWFVSSNSKVFFLNMIAYELCSNIPVDMTVMSYINFMKLLIDSPADVKELREKRILFTSLGSDEDVVKLYKDFNTYGMGEMFSFMEVKRRIQEHYDSKAKTWMAEFCYTYFSSPWSIIAWFAGVLILVLTVIQTYFTVYPSEGRV